MKDSQDYVEYFERQIAKSPDASVGLAAMETLMEIINNSKYNTITELRDKLTKAIEAMAKTENPVAAVNSGCELFMRFITLTSLETPKLDECKKRMLSRGQLFINKLRGSHEIIAKSVQQFITDGSRILTHSRSRVVLHSLKKAAALNRRFHVYVTKSSHGEKMIRDLKEANISCTLISESAVGSVLENIDFVMVGAEEVTESGGIINKIGTYMIAICALTMKKPFYVLTRSYKFSRLYPLSQSDLPQRYKFTPKMLEKMEKTGEPQDPLVDYTPPTYITLLFTDLGILTPSAVSDELIKLYL